MGGRREGVQEKIDTVVAQCVAVWNCRGKPSNLSSGCTESRETRSAGLRSRLFPGKVLRKLPSRRVHFEDMGRRLGRGKGEKETGEGRDVRRRRWGGREKLRQKRYEQTQKEQLSSVG